MCNLRQLLLNLLNEARVIKPPQQGPSEKKICMAASAHTYDGKYSVLFRGPVMGNLSKNLPE